MPLTLTVINPGSYVTSSNIEQTEPYHYSRTVTKVPDPAISVSGLAADFSTAFEVDTPVTIKLCAIAIPSGITGPSSASGMMLDYFDGNLCEHDEITYKTRVPNTPASEELYHVVYNKAIIYNVQDDPGTFGNNMPISGNANYDVYAAYISYFGGELINYSDLMFISGARSPAPVCHYNDDIVAAIVSESTELSGEPIQKITFDLQDTLSLFANTSDYGVGYSYPASSGLAYITCSGIGSELWYPITYDGNASSTPYSGYISAPGESISWRLPKYKLGTSRAGYQGYDFYVTYVNSSGTSSQPMKITYTEDALTRFNEGSSAALSTLDSQIGNDSNWTGPKDVTVDGKTYRKRLSIGINDIDIESVTYKEKGTYVSNLFYHTTPIYAVSFDSTEQFPRMDLGNYNKWDYVRYYIQFGSTENGDWHRITTRSRINEVDDDSNLVPSVIILDSLVNEADKQLMPVVDNIKFVDIGKRVHNFRIKIEIDVSKSAIREAWSPMIYDYKAIVLNRDQLSANRVERHLFS